MKYSWKATFLGHFFLTFVNMLRVCCNLILKISLVFFEDAQAKTFTHPKRVEILQEISHDPKYYASYVLKSFTSCLGKQRDSCAEQNNSSVVAYLGKSGKDIIHQVHIYPFKAKYTWHNCITTETETKQILSQYMFNSIFLPYFLESQHIQVIDSNGNVWHGPWEQKFTKLNNIKFIVLVTNPDVNAQYEWNGWVNALMSFINLVLITNSGMIGGIISHLTIT